MEYKSYAKVNLYLKIGRRLRSGYHTITSVMQLVQLHDNLIFEPISNDRIIVESNNRDLESENNLAYKAAEILKNTFKIKKGIKIFVEKNIPISAGLGGGSSNAATALTVLNKLWNLRLNERKLIEIAIKIGSDVPFFVKGATALVEGIGDKVKPIKRATSINIVLANPGIKISTTWAYNRFDKLRPTANNKANCNALIRALGQKDMKEIAKHMHNDFESIVEKKHSLVKEIKTNNKKMGALRSMVVGSGPTVIGVYDSIYTAREAYFKLKDLYPFVYLTKTF